MFQQRYTCVCWVAILSSIYARASSQSDQFTMSHRTPRYFQANITFAGAKQYLQQNLPFGDVDNITFTNIEFGVLCAATGRLVEASIVNPQESDLRTLISQYATYARQNYKEVARSTNELLEKTSRKVAPITHLINTLCTPTSYFDCNGKVDARVLSEPYSLRLPAKLFIHLGKLSKNILRNQILTDKLVKSNEVESYISQHAADTTIEKLIKKIARTYTIMKIIDTA